MKWWFPSIVVVLASFIGTAVREYREAHSPVPSYAGRLCDEVGIRTRHADATVGWYDDCIHQVAIEAAKK